MPKYSPAKLRLVEQFLGILSDDDRVLELLGYSLGRVLLKTPGDLDDLAQVADEWLNSKSFEVAHVGDWIISAVVNEEAWLARTDSLGRPKKLMKLASLDAMTAEADKAMLAAANRGGPTTLAEGDEALYRDLGDGYSLVRLLTPEALDRESEVMQHCIGGGAYDERVLGKRFVYLSLRDRFGKAHATIEIDNQTNAVIQYQGKQNRRPDVRYGRALVPFFDSAGMSPRCPTWCLGYLLDDEKKRHDLGDLPEGLFIVGDLDLSGCREAVTLPQGLYVSGTLDISGTHITEIPKGSSLGGLTAVDCALSALPDNLNVSGTVRIMGTNLKALPKRMRVGGGFIAGGLDVDTLPDGMVITGDAVLSGSHLRSVPGTAWIGGSLQLDGCERLRVLGDGLEIKNDLLLRGSGISVLPERLFVGGDLDIEGTAVVALSAKGSVGKNLLANGSRLATFGEQLSFAGNVDLTGTPMSRVPDGLSCGGTLILSHSDLAEFGEHVYASELDASDSRIRTVPLSLSVRGAMNFRRSDLKDIPTGFAHAGHLNISSTKVTDIPANVRVGSLTATHLKGLSIDRGLDAGDTLNLNETEVVAWTGPTVTRELSMFAARVSALPDDLTVTGYFTANRAHIGRWPTKLKIGGSFSFLSGSFGLMPELLETTFDFVMSGAQGVAAPRRITCGGNVDFSETRIEEFPESMDVNGSAKFSCSNVPRIPASYRIARHLIVIGGDGTPELQKGLSVGLDIHLRGPVSTQTLEGVTWGGNFSTQLYDRTNLDEILSAPYDVHSWHPYFADKKIYSFLGGLVSERPMQGEGSRPWGR